MQARAKSQTRAAWATAVKVSEVRVEWFPLDLTGAVGRAYERVSHGGPPPSLARARLTCKIEGPPTGIVNALRRVFIDEMESHRLSFKHEDYNHEASTDPYMAEVNFVMRRVWLLPLAPQIPHDHVRDLSFSLDVRNESASVAYFYAGDLKVQSGRLDVPLFNATTQLGFLQPGDSIRIDNIRLESGRGLDHASFCVATTAALAPLDLEEWSEADTHEADGPAASLGRYKVSPLLADPRVHRLAVSFAAHPRDPKSTRLVAVDACSNILRRCQLVQSLLDGATQGGSTFVTTQVEDGTRGVLTIPGETDTIGNALRCAVAEREPGVKSVSYTCIPHEKVMRLTVVRDAEEVASLIWGAAEDIIAAYTEIRSGLH